jgi:ADP-ribose pyrophosphatase
MRRGAKLRGDPIADGPADAIVSGCELLASGYRPYQRVRFRLATGGGAAQTRDILRSGPVAAVLPIDLARDEIVLLQQFRVAAQLANGNGNLVEIVAGYVEANERPIEAARRECIEEIGVAPSPLIELFSFFTSPGMSDEAITLFLGIVDAARVPQRAGVAAEREEIALMRSSIDAALAALGSGRVHNGPLLVALQWLALNRGRLAEIVRSASS